MKVTYQKIRLLYFYVWYLLLKVEVRVKVQGLGRLTEFTRTPHRVCKSDPSLNSVRIHPGEPSCYPSTDKLIKLHFGRPDS